MELPPEALEGRENFDIIPTSPEGPIAYDYDTTDDINSTSEFVKAGEVARGDAIYEALNPTQQAQILVDEKEFTGLPDIERVLAEAEANRLDEQTRAQAQLLEEDKPLDAVYDPVPEGKYGNMVLAKDCLFCDYKERCWSDVNGGEGLRIFKYSNGRKYFTHVEREPNVSEVL